MKTDINQFLVKKDVSVKSAMSQMGVVGEKILFVVGDDNEFLGSLTDGDIRRWVLKAKDLSASLNNIYNKNAISVKKNYELEYIKKIMLDDKITAIPVVDNNIISDILLWEQVFAGNDPGPRKLLKADVVIMAGGKGSRLGPFTNVFPKALIPVGDKPMVSIIIEKFVKQGAKRFFITLNHNGKMIEFYFENIEKDFFIKYIYEKSFLGTAGSLTLLPKNISDTVLVSNCDIIVDTDYSDFIRFHEENNNMLTVVGSMQQHVIPYGVIAFGENGEIKAIKEKPEYDLMVNTGLYILSKKALKYIPENKVFNMTDLIEVLLSNQESVKVFPVAEKAYIDVGQWDEYKKAITDMKIDC